ncbi:type 1 glutamine amidotransferase [Tropicibacter sp. R15_0]|uniref:type 1 glutamine amidotransferase n=1 Tax=Tropicibacter sp. R15_0 TaxID=2821101 RepID=UPI001ADC987C|nr:type 1 glutamine amidotransferase [Tropicibacter sp. R15_0]MBO9465037.1 type 1 glutamine amidotransferase [Tropicibacter sp. R15_0]
MKIGILQTGLVPEDLVSAFGEYPQVFQDLLAEHGFDFDSYSVVRGEFPSGPEAADGWLITGSRHGVYEDHDWIPPLEELIRSAVAADRPVVGVCFGHQIIAQALGGHVEKFKGGWAIGPQDYELNGETVTVNAWHQDQVITPPEGAETVGSNAFCQHAALLYPGKAYSVQPHPEFSDAYTQALIDTRGPGLVPQDILDGAAKRLGAPLSQAKLAAQFALFFREGRIS